MQTVLFLDTANFVQMDFTWCLNLVSTFSQEECQLMARNGSSYRSNHDRFDGCYNFNAFKSLAEQWKADVVRIAMYVNEQGYNTKPAYWKGRVTEMVDWAGQLGMYVLIDWHTLTPGDPNDGSYNNKWDFWGYISSKYSGQAHVLYEICNEPNGVNWGQIVSYAKPLIEMIRQKDPTTVIIVGTPQWSSDIGKVQPLPYKNLMYTLHFYAASAYGQDYVKQQAGRIPLFVTEYGTCTSSGDGKLDFGNADKWVSVLNGANNGGQKISFINWSFSSANESCAALTKGACDSHSFTSTSESGKWVMKKLQEAH